MAKIMLVEDNELNRHMLTRRLEQLGYSILVAFDGETGYAMGCKERPDLIVMDIGLPHMDGLQVTQLLKSNDQTREIPIIVLTAHTESEYRKQAFAGGCDEYVIKPVAFGKLSEMIQNLLERKTVVRT